MTPSILPSAPPGPRRCRVAFKRAPARLSNRHLSRWFKSTRLLVSLASGNRRSISRSLSLVEGGGFEPPKA